MTPEFTGRVPTLWHGRGVARQLTKRLTAGRETLVIADSALTVPVLIAGSARTVRLDARSIDVTTVVTIAQEIVRRPPSVIVAIGGGSILDATKIAALALAGGRVFDYAVGHASRFALTLLPDAPPPVEVVAVPTTIGTSSETNSVGILRNESGYRLIVGRLLRPRHAIIDPDNLSTLTRTAVREGAIEAFLRLAGVSTSERRSTRAKSDAVLLARALLETAMYDEGSAAGRLRLARLSAATQRSAALRGDDPYGARHWYLANEVAFALGVRKMVATAAVIAAVWRRICAGDSRWGDRESLEDFWERGTSGSGLPLEPVAGIASLVDQWEIPLPQTPTADVLSRIASDTEKSWGSRQPMLRDLASDDFRDVLRDSRWSAQPVGNACRPSEPLGRR
ncbi:hypothetical protein GCM10010458_35650 [Microbacterium luteolum]|uniref:Iron-containing alcohol dehydrogenase n=1 Tax=Microbacterium luteolum TaxID=69367 RepID=A0ABY7XMR4_MICLT|nr:daptide-type RiPP biosynthesis dehydogenase [Microbacterium luteolum]WDM42438.1 iron-containing alcohol dehydrogenase [Microbacterium luteolum]